MEIKDDGACRIQIETGGVEDVAITDATCLRMERLDTGLWWIMVERSNGKSEVFHIGAHNPYRTAVECKHVDD